MVYLSCVYCFASANPRLPVHPTPSPLATADLFFVMRAAWVGVGVGVQEPGLHPSLCVTLPLSSQTGAAFASSGAYIHFSQSRFLLRHQGYL